MSNECIVVQHSCNSISYQIADRSHQKNIASNLYMEAIIYYALFLVSNSLFSKL